eukprot:g18637.t1
MGVPLFNHVEKQDFFRDLAASEERESGGSGSVGSGKKKKKKENREAGPLSAEGFNGTGAAFPLDISGSVLMSLDEGLGMWMEMFGTSEFTDMNWLLSQIWSTGNHTREVSLGTGGTRQQIMRSAIQTFMNVHPNYVVDTVRRSEKDKTGLLKRCLLISFGMPERGRAARVTGTLEAEGLGGMSLADFASSSSRSSHPDAETPGDASGAEEYRKSRSLFETILQKGGARGRLSFGEAGELDEDGGATPSGARLVAALRKFWLCRAVFCTRLNMRNVMAIPPDVVAKTVAGAKSEQERHLQASNFYPHASAVLAKIPAAAFQLSAVLKIAGSVLEIAAGEDAPGTAVVGENEVCVALEVMRASAKLGGGLLEEAGDLHQDDSHTAAKANPPGNGTAAGTSGGAGAQAPQKDPKDLAATLDNKISGGVLAGLVKSKSDKVKRSVELSWDLVRPLHMMKKLPAGETEKITKADWVQAVADVAEKYPEHFDAKSAGVLVVKKALEGFERASLFQLEGVARQLHLPGLGEEMDLDPNSSGGEDMLAKGMGLGDALDDGGEDSPQTAFLKRQAAGYGSQMNAKKPRTEGNPNQ